MRWDRRSLTAAPITANSTSTPVSVRDLVDKWAQIQAGNMAVAVEGTIDGTNWVTVDTAGPSAGKVFEIPQAFESLRVVTSGFAAGSSTVWLAFREGRSD